MKIDTIKTKYPFLNNDQAEAITDHFNKYWRSAQGHAEGKVQKKLDELEKLKQKFDEQEKEIQELRDMDNVRLKWRLTNSIENIKSFIYSDDVKNNLRWLLEPNCKNRDFNAGYHKAITDIRVFFKEFNEAES